MRVHDVRDVNIHGQIPDCAFVSLHHLPHFSLHMVEAEGMDPPLQVRLAGATSHLSSTVESPVGEWTPQLLIRLFGLQQGALQVKHFPRANAHRHSRNFDRWIPGVLAHGFDGPFQPFDTLPFWRRHRSPPRDYNEVTYFELPLPRR